MKPPTFPLNQQPIHLPKHTPSTKHTIIFITNLFFQLPFLKIHNPVLSILPDPPKKDLTPSASYTPKQP
ncbi:single-stranded-DNA-specific exonuclease C-terminal domain-containing protein, partial [Bacillus pumilus]|uniref:single-stranded-DNA-specific exonuclease C-terminal domain-containing protein n=1 Tax=Bacillus pumilus TaxID=1408 RepID=UPI0034D960EF